MERHPRPSREQLFSVPMIVRGVAQGAVAFLCLAVLLIATTKQGMPAPETRALIFFALVSAVVALVLVNRAFSRSIADALLRGNAVFRYVLGGIVIVGAAILVSPFIQNLLQFAPLDAAEIGLALMTGAVLLIVLEWTKLWGRRHAY